jgi:hypothetical protein
MASVHREVIIDARPEDAWDALRDVGAIHTRLARGFVTDVRLEDGARMVTGGPITHYNASAQVIAEGVRGTRFVWIADFLPHELAPTFAGMIEQGLAAIRETLEQDAGSRPAPP